MYILIHLLFIAMSVFLAACDNATEPSKPVADSVSSISMDAQLKSQVESALAGASD
ncbi:MAG: hypothetical protein QGG54_00120 [Gammaproteobacteria bacterium]|nr:hypothetical protein [Gammaproteobacteria bacterium]MDP6537452.1 hypothetical protein [Gammaproteobacteria bacterium]